MSKHISILISGDGWTEDGGLLDATAESQADAIERAKAAGYEYADHIDEYDADDAPRICGYPHDGLGAYIVAVHAD